VSRLEADVGEDPRAERVVAPGDEERLARFQEPPELRGRTHGRSSSSVLLQPSTPAELPGEPDRPEVVLGAVVDAGAAEELDRLVAGQGEGGGQAQAYVLQPLALLAVDGRAHARVVRRAGGGRERGRGLGDWRCVHG